MTRWTEEQLAAIDRCEEIDIITVGADGTPRRPVPIWVVRVSNAVYVRSFRGEAGARYRHARRDGTGVIRIAGLERSVRFEPVTDGDVANAVDAAYTAKYARYGDSYLGPMVAKAAREATLRLTPGDQ